MKAMPQNQVFWYLQDTAHVTPLSGSHEADVAIIGGGMAGLNAAQAFAKKGLKVSVLEHYYCGSGASGKSSGFITANSELGLTHFVHIYGPEKARKIWDFVDSGVARIRNNIQKYSIDCDYTQEDALIVANSKSGLEMISQEHDSYSKLGYESILHSKDSLEKIINSPSFYGGLQCGDSFGISSFKYIQTLKKILQDEGVSIYEETPALAIEGHEIQTPQGKLKAKYIIVCTDRFIPELGILKNDIFQAQTFIMVSAPLDDTMISRMFPDKRYIVWDTDLVYQYYRIVSHNRLLIGGSTMFHTFRYQPTYHAPLVQRKLSNYISRKFPYLKTNFEYMWPGMIGVSRDLMPIAGSNQNTPHIYFISGATGLAWASALGNYAAQSMLENRHDFDEYFSPDRKFPLGNYIPLIAPKPAYFGLGNLISLYK